MNGEGLIIAILAGLAAAIYLLGSYAQTVVDKPKNWCEGIAYNNKHIDVISCTCDDNKCSLIVENKRN